MSKIFRRVEFGNAILRMPTQRLSDEEIHSSDTQQLIEDMYFTLNHREYGVGIAATQVGKNLAISTIDTKPTPTRPDLVRQRLTIINPEITKVYGQKIAQWEGCISGPNLYARVPRYTKVRLKWQDENANIHEQDFDGFMAHVIQHEVDHLKGILFVDKVEDTKSYMTFREYKKMRIREKVTIGSTVAR
jgi:peptide deformylase